MDRSREEALMLYSLLTGYGPFIPFLFYYSRRIPALSMSRLPHSPLRFPVKQKEPSSGLFLLQSDGRFQEKLVQLSRLDGAGQDLAYRTGGHFRDDPLLVRLAQGAVDLQLGADLGDAVFPCHLRFDGDTVIVQAVPVQMLQGGDVPIVSIFPCIRNI